MANIKTTVQRLSNAHDRLGTWRAVSQEIELETGIHVPAGTLCYIVKMDGEYIPHNRLYLAALKLKRKSTPRAPRTLYDLPPRALAWMLEHREVM